mgnify:CR=1 FL=1
MSDVLQTPSFTEAEMTEMNATVLRYGQLQFYLRKSWFQLLNQEDPFTEGKDWSDIPEPQQKAFGLWMVTFGSSSRAELRRHIERVHYATMLATTTVKGIDNKRKMAGAVEALKELIESFPQLNVNVSDEQIAKAKEGLKGTEDATEAG